MRSRLCRACGGFHDIEQAWPEDCASHFGQKASDAPYVRTDGMADTRNMADGKVYDSKSAYYASVKAAGCEIVGNDRAWKEPTRRPTPVQRSGEDIRRAIHQLRNQ